jgi:hypothetical protein
MNVEIINAPFSLTIHGFFGVAVKKDYAGTAFKLMDKMWQIVKSNGLKNKGMNIWVYEPGEKVFAGVELDDTYQHTGLEQKNIHLEKYAYYKHIGPYNLIRQAGQNMQPNCKNSVLRPVCHTLKYTGTGQKMKPNWKLNYLCL